MKKSSKYTVPSIDKAIDIIMLLSQRPNLTLKEIYSELQLPISTSFNIVTTLENRGFIEKNKQTLEYKLGLTLMKLGLEIYDSIDIRKVAYPIMEDLVSEFGETSYLTSIDEHTYEGVVLEKVESSQTVTVIRSIGSKVPLYASATGKSLLSGLTEEEFAMYVNQVEFIQFSNKTITTKETLAEELVQIRKNGFALTEDEMGDGVSSISAPITNFQGKVVAAVSVAGPTSRMKEKIEGIIPHVKAAAERISKKMQNKQ